VIWSGVKSGGNGFADVADAVEGVLLVTEVLGTTCVLGEGGLVVAATVLVEVLLAEEESGGPSTDDEQPTNSKAADTARAAIADPRTIDRVITLPFQVWKRTPMETYGSRPNTRR
jgi:hypothetical protein